MAGSANAVEARLSILRSHPSMKFGATARPLAALYSSTFLSGAWAMVIPTIPVIAREFDVSAGAAAQIVTAFAIGKFVGTVVAGIMLDRMGTRVGLIAGPLVASVASFATVIALAERDPRAGTGYGGGGQPLVKRARDRRNRSRGSQTARSSTEQPAWHLQHGRGRLSTPRWLAYGHVQL